MLLFPGIYMCIEIDDDVPKSKVGNIAFFFY
jgi:hypothetical protein